MKFSLETNWVETLPSTDLARNLAKGLIDLSKHLQDGWHGILDSHRDFVELRKVSIAGLHGDCIKACTEHGRVTLVGNGADEHSPQAEEAGLGQCFHHLTGHRQRTRQIGLARQCGNETAASFQVGLQILERFDPFGDFGIVNRTNVASILGAALRLGRVEVPILLALDLDGHEFAVRRELGGKALVEATLDQFGIERLIGDIETLGGSHGG